MRNSKVHYAYGKKYWQITVGFRSNLYWMTYQGHITFLLMHQRNGASVDVSALTTLVSTRPNWRPSTRTSSHGKNSLLPSSLWSVSITTLKIATSDFSAITRMLLLSWEKVGRLTHWGGVCWLCGNCWNTKRTVRLRRSGSQGRKIVQRTPSLEGQSHNG